MTEHVLTPVLPGGPVDPTVSVWIGQVQVNEVDDRAARLVDGDGFTSARLLVRQGNQPLGFVTVPVVDGRLPAGALAAAAAGLPRRVAAAPSAAGPSTAVSVVLCTRDRPDHLRVALSSIVALRDDDLEVVVVDNAPRTDGTREVVSALRDPRVRMVTEPAPGLSRARNAGLLTARNPVVAFTDDDVVVDPSWLVGLRTGFKRGDDVACVTGLVPSAEVRTPSQVFFERRVTWSADCAPREYRMSQPPADSPLFPFQAGVYGTGANFAVRRDVVLALGGFDEALGAGSPTKGGEDIDMFLRVILAGYAIAFEPAAIVWHRHRDDEGALRDQAFGYGLGLGAWLAKLALRPATATMLASRAVRGARHARQVTDVDVSDLPGGTELGARLSVVERRAILRGPWALASARAHGARSRPLSSRRGEVAA